MNKLTPIFIAGAVIVAGGLTYAQSQIGEQGQREAMTQSQHAGHGTSTPSDNPIIRAYTEANVLAAVQENGLELPSGAAFFRRFVEQEQA